MLDRLGTLPAGMIDGYKRHRVAALCAVSVFFVLALVVTEHLKGRAGRVAICGGMSAREVLAVYAAAQEMYRDADYSAIPGNNREPAERRYCDIVRNLYYGHDRDGNLLRLVPKEVADAFADADGEFGGGVMPTAYVKCDVKEEDLGPDFLNRVDKIALQPPKAVPPPPGKGKKSGRPDPGLSIPAILPYDDEDMVRWRQVLFKERLYRDRKTGK